MCWPTGSGQACRQACRGDAPDQRAGSRVAAMAQEAGQRRGADFTRRVLVVAGRPVEQREQRGIEQRLGIEHRQHAPQATWRQRRMGRQAHDHGDALAVAEGNQHPLAGLRAAPFRREIIERRHDGRVDDHFEDCAATHGIAPAGFSARRIIYPQFRWISLWTMGCKPVPGGASRRL